MVGAAQDGPEARRPSGFPVRAAAAVLVVLAVVAIASFPPPPPGPHGLRTAVLTHDRADVYTWRATPTRTAVAAPASNVGANLRAVFWHAETPVARDGTTCATWRSATHDLAQQGAALRIWRRGNRVRALTVTKNVFSGGFWGFNVHVWDSRTEAIDLRGAWDLGDEFSFRGETQFAVSLPWRMCARTRRDRLEFRVWRLSEPEPAWGDPGHGGSMKIPADVPRAGRVGWYIGHVQPGARALFTALSTAPAPGPVDLPDPDDVGGIADLRTSG